MRGCDGMHCDGCRHGGGPAAAAVVVLLLFIAVGLHAEWHAIAHVLEIIGYTLAAVAGVGIAGVVTVRALRLRRYRATVTGIRTVSARILADRIDTGAGRRALGAPPLPARDRRRSAWPLPGWWEEVRPGIGGDDDDARRR